MATTSAAHAASSSGLPSAVSVGGPSALAAAMATRRGFSKPAPVTALPGPGAAGGGGGGGLGRGRRDRGAASGLRNGGNSCYLIAVLQALLGQRSFVSDLLQAAAVLQGHVTPEQRAKAEQAEQAAAERAAAARARREAGHDSDSEWAAAGDDAGASGDSLPAAASRLSHTFYESLLSLVRDMRTSDHGILDAAQLQELFARRYQRFAGDNQQDAHEFLSECLTHLDDDIGHMLKQHVRGDEAEDAKIADGDSQASVTAAPAPAAAADAATASTAAASSTRGRSSPSAAPAAPAAPGVVSSSSSSSRPATPSPPPAFLSSPSSLQLQVDTLSPIYRNFHIEVEQRLECVTCAYARCRTEHFTELSLDLPEQSGRAATASPSSRSASPANSLAASPAPLPAASSSSSSSSSRTPQHPISPEPHSPDSPASPSASPPLNGHASTRRTLPPRGSRSSAASDGSVSASPSPLPVPECPKHLRPMIPVQASGAATTAAAAAAAAAGTLSSSSSPSETQYRCPTQRCKEVRSLPANTSFNVSLSSMTHPSSGASKANLGVRRTGKGSNGGCSVSLSDLLCQFFAPSITTYRCERCSGDKLKQSYAFRQLPRVLILHLKRFTPNLLKGSYEKRTDRVKVDEQIDLGFACTTHTRKPLPLDHGPHASTASHFAALFASSAIAACKCGAGADKCKHAQGILATPDDIASFIAHQGADAAAAAAAATAAPSAARSHHMLTRPRRNKRKNDDADDENGDHKKTKSSSPSPPPSDGAAAAVGSFAVPHDDCASFFLTGASAGAAQRLSARINALQGEIRHLQHQIHSLTHGGGDSASGASLGSAVPSRRKRDQALQGMVMRLSEMEAALKEQKEEQRILYDKERNGRTGNNSAATRNNVGSAAPPNGSVSSSTASLSRVDRSVSPPEASSLGPSVVPVYELQCVIHHKGPIATSGHYLTDLKSEPTEGQQGAVWRRYDDQYVRVIDATQAMQYGESAGYIYIYTYQPLNNLQHEQIEAQHAHKRAQQEGEKEDRQINDTHMQA